MSTEPPSMDELKRQLLDAQETIRALRAEREHAHTEEAMRETERGLLRERALLRALIDSIPDLIFFKDRESRYLGCNKAFEVSSRRQEHALIGETDHFVSTPEIAEQYRAEDREVLSTGVALRVEEWVTSESGERRLFDTLKTPYHGPDGEVRGLIGVSRDITYRTRSEQALRESEERYRTLVENLDDAVYATTPDGRFSYVSAAIAKFGVTPDQLLGEALLRFVHPDDVDEAGRRFAQALDGLNEPYEFRLIDAKGKLRYVRSSSRAAIEDGRVVGLRGVLVDLTPQREAEEQLRMAIKMEAVGRLAGGVAHDFNNLLSVIGSYAEFALGELRSEDPLYADISEIRKAAERAGALTRQLLAFSRKQVLRPEVVDLNHLVSGIETMLRRLIGEDVELVFGADPELARTRADPGQIEQVLMNLSVNARDAMPDGGRLTIETANVDVDEHDARLIGVKPGAYVRLTVADSGAGMDDETLGRIFEPFFTTKGLGKGTGLGLAMVYGFVKQTGGGITVRSEPGAGATFAIYLAAEGADDPGVAARRPASKRPEGTETVLVVEDEEAVRNLARRILAAAGYTVLTAANGGEALLLCERRGRDIDLLLTDVVMPGLDGRALAERLAPLCPATRVLYMSGYTDDVIAHRGVIDPGTHFIAKPFSVDGLTRAVRAALDDR